MKDRSKVLFGFVMLLMVVGIIGFSYAIFTTKVEKKGALNIVAGTVTCPIQIEGIEGNQVELVNQIEKEVEVTIRNDSQVPIHSTITYLKNDNVEVLASNQNGDSINKESLSVGEARTYTIKLINKTNINQTVTLNGRCGLSNKELAIADTEKDITGNYERVEPNAPKLVTGMIPVIYDENQNSWVKADTTKKWYNYDKQEWANAVTVVEKTTNTEKGHNREDYMNAEPGTPILMDDINTMWVWIPRYEYKYTNLGDQYAGGTAEQPGEIVINFLNRINDTSSDSTNYRVHPAFNFGEDKLTGFWYGKFEPSPKTKCTASFSAEKGCDLETLIPQIKPNVASWRGIRISTEFTVSQKMITEHASEYGFNNNGNTDTHMSKNSEWGAVTYLSQSKYGKYGNSLYTGVYKEVYQNKSDSYLTGNSNGTPSQEASREEGQCAYNDMINLGEGKGFCGPGASTTGNITGIYDMSGGAYELVMSSLDDGNGKPRSGKDAQFNSGFKGLLDDGTLLSTGRDLPEPKYYDLYTSTNPSSTDGRLSATACGDGICYGHALSETLGWYDDLIYFPRSQGPWIRRGGVNINSAVTGMFSIGAMYGNAATDNTFRIVLASIEQ